MLRENSESVNIFLVKIEALIKELLDLKKQLPKDKQDEITRLELILSYRKLHQDYRLLCKYYNNLDKETQDRTYDMMLDTIREMSGFIKGLKYFIKKGF